MKYGQIVRSRKKKEHNSWGTLKKSRADLWIWSCWKQQNTITGHRYYTLKMQFKKHTFRKTLDHAISLLYFLPPLFIHHSSQAAL